ncbi:MAG: ComF family protein [Thermodesulfobacteriota bacterium]|nr:ComF family protein [Thermodesulfobacteriota bacterium]
MCEQHLKVDNIYSRIINAFARALFPARCPVCGSFFHSNMSRSVGLPEKELKDKKPLAFDHVQDFQEQRVITCLKGDFKFDRLFSPYLCSACLERYAPVESPICIRCGIMFKSREGDDHLCGDCIKEPKRFKIARAPGIYDRTLMKAIHCLKYSGKIQMARPFGMLLFAAFIRFWHIKNIDLIIPVPLHTKRLKERGFNQSYLLVRNWKQLAAKLSIEMSNIAVERNVLVRSRWTEPQTGLGRKKRMKNIKNAFKVNDCSRVSGKRILLVDDVLTTGATVNECAKTLISDGAKRVDVLTLARAM